MSKLDDTLIKSSTTPELHTYKGIILDLTIDVPLAKQQIKDLMLEIAKDAQPLNGGDISVAIFKKSVEEL